MVESQFGGDWTKKKLDCLKNYLKAYELVMQNTSFDLFYIDAFAGSGYRKESKKENDIRKFLEGSPRVALKNTTKFCQYIFIEKDSQIFQKLKKIKNNFPSKKNRF